MVHYVIEPRNILVSPVPVPWSCNPQILPTTVHRQRDRLQYRTIQPYYVFQVNYASRSILALAHCFCRKNAYLAHVARFLGHIHTSLLLVNRQIYAESRHLSFKTSVSKFCNHHDSGTCCCRGLLTTIAEWQVRRLQHVDLTSWNGTWLDGEMIRGLMFVTSWVDKIRMGLDWRASSLALMGIFLATQQTSSRWMHPLSSRAPAFEDVEQPGDHR